MVCTSRDELQTLWQETRLELMGNRRHLGPEFENVVTKHFDEGLARLSVASHSGAGIRRDSSR
jgi:hypothetical protein